MGEKNQRGSRDALGYRLGLALSGGGFRASFFHIGVLARLAELDLLRHIQVISTVSGGSIIGALYYLHVRNLLQHTPDDQITCADYVTLVDVLQHQFAQAVSRNFRMRTFGNICKNWKMYRKDYSRSDRIAELYTEFLYAPVVEESLQPTVPLAGLKIRPQGERPDFHPFASDKEGRTANDRRRNKVPVLMVNTTALNTGHNFQFTATWMGEPPQQRAQRNLDKNLRLRRAYYTELPEKYRQLPLGIAVAASAAVPGVFYPLALTELYAHITPELVDGGVHDNQGTEGLLDSECTHVIVSDASGQMGDVVEPITRSWSVLNRSNSVLMDRVREEQYEGLVLREAANTIRRFAFFHLKQDLEQQEKTWIEGADKPGQQGATTGTTAYGVARQVQKLLSDIRTDLDSFTEVEAHALMADGYLICEHEISEDARQALDPAATSEPLAQPHGWHFLNITPYLRTPKLAPRFTHQLEVAGSLFLKVWKLLPWLKWSVIGLLSLLVVYLLVFFFTHRSEPIPVVETLYRKVNTYGALAVTTLTLGLYGVLYLLPPGLRWVASLQGLPRRLVLRLALVTFGFAGVWLHLLIFDRLFLWQGRISRLR